MFCVSSYLLQTCSRILMSHETAVAVARTIVSANEPKLLRQQWIDGKYGIGRSMDGCWFDNTDKELLFVKSNQSISPVCPNPCASVEQRSGKTERSHWAAVDSEHTTSLVTWFFFPPQTLCEPNWCLKNYVFLIYLTPSRWVGKQMLWIPWVCSSPNRRASFAPACLCLRLCISVPVKMQR